MSAAAKPEEVERPRARGDRWTRRRFAWWLGAVTVVGGAWRVAYVLAFTRYENGHVYDDFYYLSQSWYLTHGHFFLQLSGHGPDAAHPPLTSFVLVPATYLFGIHPGTTPQRLTMAVIGTLTITLVGLLGRQVLGPRGGVLSAAMAAAYPNMWLPDGIVMSEALSMALTTLVLLGVYRLLRRPSYAVGVGTAVACGLDVLTREELVLFLPFLVLPAALAASEWQWRRRLALGAVTIVVTLLTVAPWWGRNLATFKEPVFVSTGQGAVLLGSNCPQTYAGPSLGSWSLQCSVAVRPAADPSVTSARQQAKALHFAQRHLGRLPTVLAARVGRLWDAFEPVQMAAIDVNEGRPEPASLAGLAAYYLFVPLAVGGAVLLRRRRTPLWPLLVPAGVLTAVSLVGYGLVRFRAPFEMCLVVLSATSVDLVVERLGRRWRPGREAWSCPPTGGRPAGLPDALGSPPLGVAEAAYPAARSTGEVGWRTGAHGR